MNPHLPVFRRYPEGGACGVECAAPDCSYMCFAGSGTDKAYTAIFEREHANQYEPGRAPDIAVDWEISAQCSVCEDGGDVQLDGGETIRCADCGTTWSINGKDGEREE